MPSTNHKLQFQFSLYDAVTNGTLVGTPASLAPVPVSNGLFLVTLDCRDVLAKLSATNSWTLIPPPYPVSGTNSVVTEPVPLGNKFFRLRKP